MGFEVWGLGFGVWGFGFEVLGLGFEIWGLRSGALDLRLWVWVVFGVWGQGLKVQVAAKIFFCGGLGF